MSSTGAADRPRSGAEAAGEPLPRWVRLAMWATLLALTLYLLAWLLGGWLRPGYDPVAQAISELFELGSPWSSRAPLLAGLVLSGLALLAAAPALERAMPGRGRLGPALVALAGLGTLGLAASPCTPGCPGAAHSTLDLLHTTMASIGYLALVSAALAFAWRTREKDARLSGWSLVLGGASVLLFALHLLGWPPDAQGSLQRTFISIPYLWYVLIAVTLLREDRIGRLEPHPKVEVEG